MQKLTTEQDAIKQAVKGGWKKNSRIIDVTFGGGVVFAKKRGHIYQETLNLAEILQDPAFWQALGKARGWKKEYLLTIDEFLPPPVGKFFEYGAELEEWAYHALRYFETRLSNGDLTAYWRSLP